MNHLAAFCAEEGLALTDRQLAGFAAFEEDLYAANEAMNLTRVSREECEVRHFIDSLLIQAWLPPGAAVVDLGTGPGLPAWPLACARPDLRVAAVDSSGKMLGFLHRHPLPNLEVVEARAEDWGMRGRFDAATGRALAPLAIQLELSAPVVRVGGLVLPFRTPNDLEAIEALDPKVLGLALERIGRRELAGTEVVRIFPIYRKRSRTPDRFPRRWAQIKERPLGA